MSVKMLKFEICIVCGESVGWCGDLPPACYDHSYGDVDRAYNKKRVTISRVPKGGGK